MAEEIITMQTEMDLPGIQVPDSPVPVNVFRRNDITPQQKDLIRRHLQWLGTVRKEYPLPTTPYRIGVYIRYFNQTKYEDYLDYHKKQFADTIALCPLWTLEGFYVDKGPSAPNMESASSWCQLMEDCFSGKINLIITQKVSNVSRKAWDLTLMIRLLAARGIGIYFISEDIFTTASYYQPDLLDENFLPSGFPLFPDAEDDNSLLPENESSERAAHLPPGGIHVE